MSKSLDSGQADALTRRGLSLVNFIKLTTYTDRADNTVDTEWMWADRYIYADNYQFTGSIAGIYAEEQSMDHLPDGRGMGVMAQRKLMVLTLANHTLDSGETLWETLRAENLLNADVEWSQLVTDLVTDTPYNDLTGHVSWGQRTVRYRGRLEEVIEADDQYIRIGFRSELPQIPWLLADDASIHDPLDLGKRLPIVYGDCKRVPAIGWEIGSVTTLAEAMTSSTTGAVEFTDVSAFASSGEVHIGAETLSYSAKSGNQLTIDGRAQQGTTAAEHAIGETATEVLANAHWVLAGHEVNAINAVYVQNPHNQQIVRLDTTDYTKTVADTSRISGETVASISFTAAQLSDLLEALAPVAAISQQPARSVDAVVAHSVAVKYANEQPTGGPGSESWDGNHLTGDWYGNDASHPAQGPDYMTEQTYTFVNRGTVISQTSIINITSSAKSSGYTEGLRVKHGDTIIAEIAGNTTGSFRFTSAVNANTIKLYPIDEGAEWGQWYVVNVMRDVEATQTAPTVSTQPQVATTGGTEVKLTGFSMGYGLRFFADISGMEVPAGATTWPLGYGFENGSGWNTLKGTQSADGTYKTQGSFSQKLACIAGTGGSEQFNACDSLTGWYSTFIIDSIVGSPKSEGTGSIEMLTEFANMGFMRYEISPDEDWSGRNLKVDIYIPSSNGIPLTATDGVRIRLRSAGSGNWSQWWFGTGDGLAADDAWHTITLDVDSTPDESNNSFDSTEVNQFVLRINTVSPASGKYAYMDDIRTVWGEAGSYISKMQRNSTSGTVDLTASADTYKVDIRANDKANITALEVYFSNTAGSGVTKPVAYRSLAVSVGSLVEDTWVEFEIVGSDTGSPGVDDIDTIGVWVTVDDDANTADVWIDNLRVKETTGGDYEASPGAMIEDAGDILIHVLTELVSGTIRSGDITTLRTNLHASAKYACVLNELGQDFASILARLGYEMRTNIVAEEALNGTQWHLLAATTSYAFPAVGGSLTEYQTWKEKTRTLAEVATRFRFGYDVDRTLGIFSLGAMGEAFPSAVNITAENNDVSDPSVSDLEDAEEVYGRLDAPFVGFLCVVDETTAEDVAAYYVHEKIRAPRIFELRGVGWDEGYALERGDIVGFTPPAEAVELKCRVIGYRKEADSERIDLKLVEVT